MNEKDNYGVPAEENTGSKGYADAENHAFRERFRNDGGRDHSKPEFCPSAMPNIMMSN